MPDTVMTTNPKLEGSGLVDCIPQTGQCPGGCHNCYYNADDFYRTKDESLIPTAEEAEGKIVRMNSGHDSNIQKHLVLETAKRYDNVFFNTSLPMLSFPGPVVFTVNGPGTDRWAYLLPRRKMENLMFVRVRVNTWNLDLVASVCAHYSEVTPVVLTYMRYANKAHILPGARESYERRQHIKNVYWMLKPELEEVLTATMQDRAKGEVLSCGSPESKLCRDCGNCERLYWRKVGA